MEAYNAVLAVWQKANIPTISNQCCFDEIMTVIVKREGGLKENLEQSIGSDGNQMKQN